MNAQKRFEKEVLMVEDLIPSGRSNRSYVDTKDHHGLVDESEKPFLHSQFLNFTDNSNKVENVEEEDASSMMIESRSSKDVFSIPAQLYNTTKHLKVKSLISNNNNNNPKLPIMTSIEIYDLPSANKYFGLAEPISSSLIPIRALSNQTVANENNIK